MKLWLSWGPDVLLRNLGTTLDNPEIKSNCVRFMDARGKGLHTSLVSKSGFLGTQEAKKDLNGRPSSLYL